MNPKLENNLYELNLKLKDLFDDLDQKSEEQLARPEEAGKWSINQVLVHLLTSERGSYQYIQKKMQSTEPFKKENVVSHMRYFALVTLLSTPIKFKMPKKLKDPQSDLSYAEIRSDYVEVRNELEYFLKSFPEALVYSQIFKHPIAGRFSLPQMIKFLNFHFEHHMYQINRISKKFD